MNTTLLNGLRFAAIGAGLIGTVTGFVVDRNDARELDSKLQEMRDIEERIRQMNNK